MRCWESRCEITPHADPSAIFEEDDWDGDEKEGDAADEGSGPLDADAFEEVGCEEGENGAGEGTEECVCCDGGCGAVRGRWGLADCVRMSGGRKGGYRGKEIECSECWRFGGLQK